MAGLLDRKNQLSAQKIQTQIDTMMPSELKQTAQLSLDACKDSFINSKTKDACERTFYSTKCMYDFDPANFLYPWKCCGSEQRSTLNLGMYAI